MAQSPLRLIGTNNYTYGIEVMIGSKRVEFFIKPDMFAHRIRQLNQWIKDGWYNHAVSQMIQSSTSVWFEEKHYAPQEIILQEVPWTVRNEASTRLNRRTRNMGRNIPRAVDSVDTPDAEHQFTLIAPEAQNGLVYQGTRVWHKSAEAAVEYAKLLYNANKDASFELIVVQAVESIQPKPQIELVSRSFAPKESASS